MVTNSSPRDKLAEAMRLSLLPQPFPFRRDVEFYGGLAPREKHLFAYDYHWPRRNVLAASVVSISGCGIETSIAATSLRHLLRAALGISNSPQSALEMCSELLPSLEASVAIACLDLDDGSIRIATSGDGAVTGVPENGALAPGALVWLTSGGLLPPSDGEVPVSGLKGLVDPTVSTSTGGCAVALQFKGQRSASDSATFVIANDAAAIPGFLQEVEKFLSARSAGDDAIGLDVALDELLTNTISYAFADGHMHEIVATLELDGGDLVIELRDDGKPFDPLSIPEPDLDADIEERQLGGLGMHFVRTVMDDVSYDRSGGWNVLTLRRHLGGSNS